MTPQKITIQEATAMYISPNLTMIQRVMLPLMTTLVVFGASFSAMGCNERVVTPLEEMGEAAGEPNSDQEITSVDERSPAMDVEADRDFEADRGFEVDQGFEADQSLEADLSFEVDLGLSADME